MYLNCKVKVPEAPGKLTTKRIKNTPYIYFEYARDYNREKRYNSARRVCIGKACEDQTGMMIPNANFLRYFPEIGLPEEAGEPERSSCLHVGAFFVIRKVIEGYFLDRTIAKIIGKDAGLFLDLAAYLILTEENAAQYYPEYAYNHPLLTEDMKVYSDSRISDFLNQDMTDKRISFLNEWNQKRDHREKIYISYDSTNKNCQAGEVDLAEIGHAREDDGKPVINYFIAYDRKNEEPLFYEAYPGSIVDVSQFTFMVDKAMEYGYKKLGFILDRGYFSKENIRYMDDNGYSFIIMCKGHKDLVSSLILSNQGTFEAKREAEIRSYKVYGITVPSRLYEDDTKERYFHIYYSPSQMSSERERVEQKVEKLRTFLEKHVGTDAQFGKTYTDYFHLHYDRKKIFRGADERADVVERELKLCGYFCIITSEEMSASQALIQYKGRDISEKLFQADKSFIGSRSERTQSSQSVSSKIFIEFIALIVRNRIYNLLKEQMLRMETRRKYMDVPAAIRELEKIEMVRRHEGTYRLDHAVTRTQKTILNSFGLDADSIKTAADELGRQLASCQSVFNTEASDNGTEENRSVR